MENPIKVLQLSTYDLQGGEGKAAYRIHQSVSNIGVNSTMLVKQATSDDPTVVQYCSRSKGLWPKAKPYAVAKALKTFFRGSDSLQSISIFPSTVSSFINKMSIDLVHIHWIQDEFISIEDIGRISKPIIWTLHDMWPFSGSEHYTHDGKYSVDMSNRGMPISSRGFEINRWCWKRKKRAWKNQMIFVGNCGWISKCAKDSSLLCADYIT